MTDLDLEQQLAQAIATELNARRVEAWDLHAEAMAEINRFRDEIQKAGRQ
jgi:post-segregation antitoxin (ccd killing protein)